MWWPPVVSLINVIVRGPSIDAALRDARLLMRVVDAQNAASFAMGAKGAKAAHTANASGGGAASGGVASAAAAENRGSSGFRVFGPARAPLARLRGEHRAQFFVKGTKRAAMRQAVMEALARHPEIARRTSVDVDPLSML